MKKYAAEFLGTFALVFAGTAAIVTNNMTGGGVTHVGIALTFGLVVMAAIYGLGDVSGAHLNPAVTIAFFLAKRFSGRLVIPYILTQVAGAFLASVSVKNLFGDYAHLGTTLPFGSPWQAFLLEVILTWFLMFVILCVSTGPKEVGIMAGAAIGGVVALEALFAGPISGASMNPARSLAPAVVSGTLTHLWVYLTAPVLGAAVAIPCWYVTRGPCCPSQE